jgi:hypothetical protein
MDLSDFEIERNRRRGSTGNRERISGNKSDGISAAMGSKVCLRAMDESSWYCFYLR